MSVLQLRPKCTALISYLPCFVKWTSPHGIDRKSAHFWFLDFRRFTSINTHIHLNFILNGIFCKIVYSKHLFFILLKQGCKRDGTCPGMLFGTEWNQIFGQTIHIFDELRIRFTILSTRKKFFGHDVFLISGPFRSFRRPQNNKRWLWENIL